MGLHDPPHEGSALPGTMAPVYGGNVLAFLLTIILFVGWFATEGTLYDYARRGWDNVGPATLKSKWLQTPFPNFHISADLEGVDFVGANLELKPLDAAKAEYKREWCKLIGISQIACLDPSGGDKRLEELVRSAQNKWCLRTLGIEVEQSRETCSEAIHSLEDHFEQSWLRTRADVISRQASRSFELPTFEARIL